MKILPMDWRRIHVKALRQPLGGLAAGDNHVIGAGGDAWRYLWWNTTVSALPDEVQDEVARMLLTFAGIERPPYV
jgi:hypothetical protein